MSLSRLLLVIAVATVSAAACAREVSDRSGETGPVAGSIQLDMAWAVLVGAAPSIPQAGG